MLMPPVPTTLGLILGDFVHNLRASLDHLVWQLVLANRRQPNSSTAFPIHLELGFLQDKAAFFKRTKPAIGGCSPGARGVIESLQPYQKGNAFEASHHPLWMLHELDIIDKHRLIAVVGGRYTATRKLEPESTIKLDDIELPVTEWKESGTFDNHLVIGEIGPGGKLESNFEPSIELGVAIRKQEGLKPGEDAAASGEKLETLGSILDYVRDDVLPPLAPFLEEAAQSLGQS